MDKGWQKVEKLPAWQLTNVKRKKELILQAQREKKQVHFAALMDICQLKNAQLEPKYQKKRLGRASKCHRERRLRLVCCNHRTHFVCVSDDSGKSNGCHSKITCLCKTSSRRSICSHPRNSGRRSKIAQKPKSGLNVEDPVVLLERNFARTSTRWTLLWDRRLEVVLLGLGWVKKYQIGHVCFFIENEDCSCRHTWMML